MVAGEKLIVLDVAKKRKSADPEPGKDLGKARVGVRGGGNLLQVL